MRDEKTAHIPEEWLVPTVRPEDAFAESVGSYRLLFEVAAGGMATVYLALYTGALGFAKVVAVKKVHKHLARESRFVEMFLDEARIAGHIDHPFVCKVVDFGKAGESCFLAMEYLVGEPLSEIWEALADKPALAAAPELPRVVARAVADLAEGLHAAHELTDEGEPLGIVHRDVTPANLFVLYDGTVRVVDFGIAKAKNRITETETGHVKGKYAYVAPEQLRVAPVDRRCDVWSLGVVLWEMLTVRRLFKRESPIDTMNAITYEDVPAPSSVRPDIPPELDAIVMRALSRRPSQRFATAREMASALEAWLAKTGEPTPRSEMSEWLDALFPGACARKRKLIELARKGDAAVPVGERGVEAPEAASMKAATTLFQPRAVPEPTAEVGEDEVQVVVPAVEAAALEEPAASETDRRPALRVEGTDARGPRAPVKKTPSSHVPLALALIAVAATGAVVAASLDGASDAEAGATPAEVTPPPEADNAPPEPTKTAPTAEDDPSTEPSAEAWPPFAGTSSDAPSPTAADGTGEVHLTAREGWADVYVAGEHRGRTPIELTLPTGRHRIVLRPYGGPSERPMAVEVRTGRRVYFQVAIPPR